MKQNTSDANMYKRQLSIEEKHTRSRGTDNCCADEATRSRGRYRDKDGGGGGAKRETRQKARKKRENIKQRSSRYTLLICAQYLFW